MPCLVHTWRAPQKSLEVTLQHWGGWGDVHGEVAEGYPKLNCFWG